MLGQPGQQQTQLAVEAVHLANGFDPRVVLGYPAAIAQAGLTFVAGAGVDLRQTKTHAHDSVFRGASGRRKVKQVPWPGADCTSICPL
ncbi:hypothetical protein D3C72_2309400 [compost metagenome]